MSETTAPRSRREIYLAMSGLMIAMLLAMLDNMIIGTAMPTIVGELGGLAHLSWVVTAYALAATASTPLWGKFGDLYGRKGIFMSSIVIFLLGSALSGAAQDMGQLIGFRAVQGLGAGGLMVGAMAIIADLVPPRERARYQGMMAAVMPLAFIGGPLLGGFFTDNLSWRWSFYINIPLGIIALAVCAVTLHLPRHRVKHTIDYAGAALLTLASVSLVLVTAWGGSEYEWASPQVIGLIAASVVSIVGFVLVERRAVEPILPLSLFANRNFTLAAVLGFVAGFAMFAAVSYLPLYQQSVQGASATNSGLLLMPMMLAAMVVSMVTGNLITRTGRYRIFPILGGIGLSAGMFLFTQLDVDTSRFTSSLFMVVLGLGLGFLMQTTMVIAQNSVEAKNNGVASSTATYFRSIGGSMGVSLLGALFIAVLSSSLTSSLGAAGAELTSGSGTLTPAALDQLPAPVHAAYLQAVVDAMQSMFLAGAVVAVVAVVAAWFIREVPLRSAPVTEEENAASPAPAVSAVGAES
ncbi:MAG TPA: MDR family MFS transporter [Jiangellaceae bacterium]